MFGNEFMFLRPSFWIKFRYIFERARDSLYFFWSQTFLVLRCLHFKESKVWTTLKQSTFHCLGTPGLWAGNVAGWSTKTNFIHVLLHEVLPASEFVSLIMLDRSIFSLALNWRSQSRLTTVFSSKHATLDMIVALPTLQVSSAGNQAIKWIPMNNKFCLSCNISFYF